MPEWSNEGKGRGVAKLFALGRFLKVAEGYTLFVNGGLGDVWFTFNKLFSNAECRHGDPLRRDDC
jgi:hypothetical protein